MNSKGINNINNNNCNYYYLIFREFFRTTLADGFKMGFQ